MLNTFSDDNVTVSMNYLLELVHECKLRVLIYKESFFHVWGLPKNHWVIFSIDYKLCYKLCDRGKKGFEDLLHF